MEEFAWDYTNPMIEIIMQLSIGWLMDCHEKYGCCYLIEDGTIKAIGKRKEQS